MAVSPTAKFCNSIRQGHVCQCVAAAKRRRSNLSYRIGHLDVRQIRTPFKCAISDIGRRSFYTHGLDKILIPFGSRVIVFIVIHRPVSGDFKFAVIVKRPVEIVAALANSGQGFHVDEILPLEGGLIQVYGGTRHYQLADIFVDSGENAFRAAYRGVCCNYG